MTSFRAPVVSEANCQARGYISVQRPAEYTGFCGREGWWEGLVAATACSQRQAMMHPGAQVGDPMGVFSCLC